MANGTDSFDCMTSELPLLKVKIKKTAITKMMECLINKALGVNISFIKSKFYKMEPGIIQSDINFQPYQFED